MPPPRSLPSPQALRLLLEREQDNEFIDLLSNEFIDLLATALQGSPVSKKNILSGWRLYLKWVREEGRGVLTADLAQAEAYAAWLKVKYEAPATLNNRLTHVRKLYGLLAEVGLWQGDAFTSVHGQVNPADLRRPVYTDAEIEKLLEVARPKERVLILLGASLGLTGPEVLRLRFEDFLENDHELRVAGRSVNLQCSPQLMLALQEVRRQQGEQPLYAVQASGLVYDFEDDQALRAAVFDLCRRAHVLYKAWMALRNHAGIQLLRETGDAKATAQQLGIGGRQALNPTVRLARKEG
ncbi:site-specific integrase [Deinococcus cavernae]|nr:site-specific integrase [Deinococcus cavernae]